MNKPSHDFCKECKDWNGCITDCMNICGIPIDIVEEWGEVPGNRYGGRMSGGG